MKKTLLIICLATALFSCKKESNTTKPTKATIDASLLVGKWVWTQDTLKEYNNGILIASNQGGVIFDGTYSMQLNSNGTGVYFQDKLSSNFTYSVKDDKFTSTNPADGIYDAFTQTGTIKILTATKLMLYYDDTETDPDGSLHRTTEASYYEKKK